MDGVATAVAFVVVAGTSQLQQPCGWSLGLFERKLAEYPNVCLSCGRLSGMFRVLLSKIMRVDVKGVF